MDQELPRRIFLLGIGSTITAVAFRFLLPKSSNHVPEQRKMIEETPEQITIAEFSNSGERLSSAQVPKIIRTEAEWRSRLSSNAFEITRSEERRVGKER